MKQYKGYYIGEGPNDFHSAQDIDAFIRAQKIKRMQQFIRMANRYTDEGMIMAASAEASKIAYQLHADGMSWDEIEAAEMAA